MSTPVKNKFIRKFRRIIFDSETILAFMLMSIVIFLFAGFFIFIYSFLLIYVLYFGLIVGVFAVVLFILSHWFSIPK